MGKFTPSKHEINPKAHKLAEDNIKLNKIDNIILINKDVRKVKLKTYDRIIMTEPNPKVLQADIDRFYHKR